MDLEQELDYAYGLVTEQTGISFDKPSILAGNDEFYKLIPIRGMKDLIYTSSIAMLYLDAENTIVVPDKLLGTDRSPCYPYSGRNYRIACFSHELGHSLIHSLNPSCDEDNLNQLAKTKNTAEKAESLYVFNEGLSDYIAIAACLSSKEDEIQTLALKRKEMLVNDLQEWISGRNIEMMSKMYGFEPGEWQKTVIKYFRRNQGVSSYFSYTVGYNFVSSLGKMDYLKIIQNPPTSFHWLLNPQKYQKRFKL